MKRYNFYAGPAILPKTVFKQAQNALVDFEGMGLSILEISHRSSQFVDVMKEAEARVRHLAGLDDSYAVLFLTGGASSQFYMLPMNVLPDDGRAAYVNTGTWSSKAIREVSKFGQVDVVSSSENAGFTRIPDIGVIDSAYSYLHLTSNNTIYGTQYHEWPENTASVPLVCDMSSDIFSRELDFSKFDMIYAGAQKNLGPSGVTLVVLKKELAGRSGRDLPTMLDYETHINKNSMFNTPPVFPIYVTLLTLRWIEEQGGLSVIGKRNAEKAKALYAELDRNKCFHCPVEKSSRSQMNVCFLPIKPMYSDLLLALAAERGVVGIKGHRSVGGFRASIYNAMDMEGVEMLISLLRGFEADYMSG